MERRNAHGNVAEYPGKGGSAGTGNAGEKKAEDQTGGGLPENGEKKETAPKTPGTPEDVPEETAVVYQPVKNIYLAASAAMDMFRALDALDTIRLSGTDADGWYIKEAREAMKSGKILYAGKYSAPDYEMLLDAGCSLADGKYHDYPQSGNRREGGSTDTD